MDAGDERRAMNGRAARRKRKAARMREAWAGTCAGCGGEAASWVAMGTLGSDHGTSLVPVCVHCQAHYKSLPDWPAQLRFLACLGDEMARRGGLG